MVAISDVRPRLIFFNCKNISPQSFLVFDDNNMGLRVSI